MKRFRFRLSSLLWLVAFAAAVLWVVRYRQDREARPTLSFYRGGKEVVIKLSPDCDFLKGLKLVPARGQEPSPGRVGRDD